MYLLIKIPKAKPLKIKKKKKKSRSAFWVKSRQILQTGNFLGSISVFSLNLPPPNKVLLLNPISNLIYYLLWK